MGQSRKNREQNFAMLNDNRDSVVSYDEFEEFVFRIMDMYSRAVSEKINENKDMIKEIFTQIAQEGKDSFTFDEYMKALDRNPDLFIWLEKPKEMMNEILNKQEGQYSKKFVDETMDLMFKYIATTEYAMKRIIKLVKEVRGDSDTGSEIEAKNLLLNLEDPRKRGVLNPVFSRQENAYHNILRFLTSNFRQEDGGIDEEMHSKKKAKSTKLRKEVIDEEYLGGDSEESDEEDELNESEEYESSEESKENEDSSEIRDHEIPQKKPTINMFSDKKLNAIITENLTKSTGDPLENIENICESMLDVSKSLDNEVNNKISNETNLRNKVKFIIKIKFFKIYFKRKF